MKKIILSIFAMCLFCTIAYADQPEMTREVVLPDGATLQQVIAWKYGSGLAETKGTEIEKWHSKVIEEPTLEQLEQDAIDYGAYLETEKTNKKNRKKAVLQKLGLNSGDIQALVELVKDGNDD